MCDSPDSTLNSTLLQYQYTLFCVSAQVLYTNIKILFFYILVACSPNCCPASFSAPSLRHFASSRYLPTIFTAQYSPHMEQPSFTSLFFFARNSRNRTGSIASSSWRFQSSTLRAFAISKSHCHACGSPRAISAACAAIFVAITPSRTSSISGSPMCSAGVT